MKVRCPKCRAVFYLEEAITSEIQARIVEAYNRLGPAGGPVREYLDLFRPSRNSPPLRDARFLRLLFEVIKILAEEEFTYYGRRYRINRAGIVLALEVVGRRDLYGLTGHNYLKKVMIGMLQKGEAAEPEKPARRTRDAREGQPGPAKLGDLEAIRSHSQEGGRK